MGIALSAASPPRHRRSAVWAAIAAFAIGMAYFSAFLDYGVAVEDEGLGSPQRDLERIFERFRRGDTSQVQNVRGVGLGLYICRSIVEAHGGRITAASEPRKGSRFTFTLPLRDPG